jgi:tetratricopeptide (TPR) repeat protein
MSNQISPQRDMRAAIQVAVSLHRGGRLDEAETLYNGILSKKHDHFDALHLLGVLMHQRGRSSDALALIERALRVSSRSADAYANHGRILAGMQRFQQAQASLDRALALKPDHVEALFHRGNILIALGRPADALHSYDRGLAIKPDHTQLLVNRGVALLKLQRPAEALAGHDKALAREPGHVQALVNRGNALMAFQRPAEALSSYDRALAVRPNDAETLFNRGNALLKLQQPADALASFEKALVLRPDHFDTLYCHGNLLRDLGRPEEALASYDRALAVRPDHAELLSNRGNVLCELDRLEEALKSFERSLALKPDQPDILSNRGNALLRLNRPVEALADYRWALALKPDHANALNNKGNVLKELGRIEEARQAFLGAVGLDPDNSAIYFNLADLKKFTPGDPHLAAMERLAAGSDSLATIDRQHLDFALGKAYADLNDFPRSFRHLLAGNAGKRSTISYDETATLALFGRIEEIFTRELIEAKSDGGEPSPRPIFVIGMPRSGTTLVEQILASHPQVRGAGELKAFSNAVSAVRDATGDPARYPEWVPSLDASALQQIGARYLAALREIAPDGERVIDKMPSNYYYAGLIRLALPNARIIHTIRDPIDTCVSCFSKLFASEQNHTYDLGELGRYYRHYERLMRHWHSVLPAGCILDVRYEDVVADLEGQARRMLYHCGLLWDDRCLAFHETDRYVSTASAAQVRQPIYAGSVGRWRAYQSLLQPLLDELGVRNSPDT